MSYQKIWRFYYRQLACDTLGDIQTISGLPSAFVPVDVYILNASSNFTAGTLCRLFSAAAGGGNSLVSFSIGALLTTKVVANARSTSGFFVGTTMYLNLGTLAQAGGVKADFLIFGYDGTG